MLSDSRFTLAILVDLYSQLIPALSGLANHSLQIEFASLLLKFSESRGLFGEALAATQDLYARALESDGQFLEAARYLTGLDDPEEDWEKLKRFLRIGEDLYHGKDYGNSFTYLSRAHAFVFRLSTPPPLLDRFDMLRGNLHIKRGSFLEAARAFVMAWQKGSAPDVRWAGLRRAAIAAVFAPPSANRTCFLRQFASDDQVRELDVFPMLDLITQNKFIDALARDEFLTAAADVVSDESARRVLETSSTQHNLSVAQNIFVSVKINRLASLIGDTPANVHRELGTMIERDVIRAEIDQPENTVIFLGEKLGSRDEAIAAFCMAVGQVKSRLKEFQ
jgi:tetratricopeptide (TPR) repeat protein